MDNTLITMIASSFSGVAAFLVGQRKARKEVESMSLQNIEDSIKIYKTIIDDLKNNIMELQKQVDILQNKVDNLMEENHQLKIMLTEEKMKNDNKR
jgi:peptidoglycan hydrolase CwlO-like protein